MNETDSAAYYYYKQYSLKSNIQKLAATVHLLELFSKVGQVDSVKKYTKLYIEKRDEYDRVSNGNQMQVLHLRFNFDKLNKELAKKSERLNQQFFFILMLCLAVVILLVIIRNKKLKATIVQEQLYLELASLRLSKKEETDGQKDWKSQVEKAKKAEIYLELKKRVMSNPPKSMDEEHKDRLYREFINFFPSHYDLIMRKKLSGAQFDICILVLFDFKPNEISKLLKVSSGLISVTRLRLCKIVFNLSEEDSSASKFDELLRKYPLEE